MREKQLMRFGFAGLLVVAGFVSATSVTRGAVEPVSYYASASVETQGSPFNGITGMDAQRNPAISGGTLAPGGVTADFSSSADPKPGYHFDGTAHAAVDPSTTTPTLHASAAGAISLPAAEPGVPPTPIYAHAVSASADWTVYLTVTGPSPTIYMTPIFHLDGSLTGQSDASTLGFASLTVQKDFDVIQNLASFAVPVDGSTHNINTTVSATAIPVTSGVESRFAFGLTTTAQLIPSAGVTPPFSASANLDFSSTAYLVGLAFYADKNLTTPINNQVSIASSAPTEFKTLIVPEPSSLLLLWAGVGIALTIGAARPHRQN